MEESLEVGRFVEFTPGLDLIRSCDPASRRNLN